MAEKCVHQGCGKLFTDATAECKYHPGPPVFHEGQKGKQFLLSTRSFWGNLGDLEANYATRMEVLQASRPYV
jgi:hypothetical protein